MNMTELMNSLLTVEEVADALRISRNTAYTGVRCGHIPSIRIGRQYRIPAQALEKLVSEVGK
jgi:excisionase family DNA binding protein